jgi:hypothetical protein
MTHHTTTTASRPTRSGAPVLALFAALLAALLAVTARAAPMTNADVIKMTAAGLDESIIVNSIEHAAEANFDVSPDGLIALSGAKVPKAVVAAIIKRDSAGAPAAAAPAAAAAADDPNALKPNQIRVIDGGQTQTMRYIKYTVSNRVRGPWGGAASYAEINGAKAALRTGASPTFLVVVPEDAQAESYITLAWLGIRKGGAGRYITMGSAAGFSASTGIPQNRTIATASEKHADQTGAPKGFTIYKITPVAPLKRGEEYAIVLDTGGTPMLGAWFGGGARSTFFDFGVNK